MGERRHKRIIVSFPAELICNDKHYAGTIENLSENGAYVITAPQRALATPDTIIALRFQSPSGEKYDLNCRLKWSYQTPPHGFTNSLGMEIIDPPLLYKELLDTLR
ncbi:MAG: PilZ domain-containing protein [Nitrospiraceae bacterium]|nr:MAG: PilZ domain-containing protein [Nitrospiraceae bacterium]